MKLALGLLAAAGLTLPVAMEAMTFAAPRGEEVETWRDGEPLEVWIETVGGRELASVHGRNVSLEHVLKEIARRTGRVVEGLSATRRGVLVSVALEERPVEQVLEYVLGGVGLVAELGPDTLRVREDDADRLSADRLRDRAMALYLRTTADHPGHIATERGRLSQGEVEHARGNLPAALEQYQVLLDSFPSSAFRAEAHLRSGAVLEELQRWAEAAQQYRLAATGAEDAPEYVPSRLGLARCQIELGNPDLALLMIESLDDARPPIDRQDQARRGLVRARAQLQREMWIDCLATLDQLDRVGLPEEAAAGAMRLRALAFEGLDLIREAGRAWLVHARMTEGVARDTAFERAAVIAMDDGDELGVLFVAAEAERAGSDAPLGPLARTARMALGLEVDLTTDDATDVERVEIAETYLELGDWLAAKPILADLHTRRTQVHPTLRQRAALAWGRCLYLDAGLEAALSVLREARPVIEDEIERLALDLMAAELLEGERQFARAVEAYEGRY